MEADTHGHKVDGCEGGSSDHQELSLNCRVYIRAHRESVIPSSRTLCGTRMALRVDLSGIVEWEWVSESLEYPCSQLPVL